MTGFFEKIAQILEDNDVSANDLSHQNVKPESKQESTTHFDGVELVSEIVLQTIKTLDVHFKGRKKEFKTKTLQFRVTDQLFFSSLNQEDFRAQMVTALNVQGYAVSTVKVALCDEEDTAQLPMVINKVYLQMKEDTEETDVQAVTVEAFVTVQEGHGSLMKKKYILDAAKNKLFLIGRGVAKRPNFIVVDDDEKSPQWENNKFVRSAHARIEYTPMGFCLFVEKDGTRTFGESRTQLVRFGQRVIEIDNPLVPYRLQSGDTIILGKTVYLVFTEKQK